MTEYEGEPFIVGDYLHNHIEFMHLSHRRWYVATDYPFQRRIFGYTAISRPSKVQGSTNHGRPKTLNEGPLS